MTCLRQAKNHQLICEWYTRLHLLILLWKTMILIFWGLGTSSLTIRRNKWWKSKTLNSVRAKKYIRSCKTSNYRRFSNLKCSNLSRLSPPCVINIAVQTKMKGCTNKCLWKMNTQNVRMSPSEAIKRKVKDFLWTRLMQNFQWNSLCES